MRILKNFIFCLARLALGAGLLLFAAGIPAYFTAVDKYCVTAANSSSDISVSKLAQIYLDAAKISSAVMVSSSIGDSQSIEPQAKELYSKHPQWIAGGGDDPFFEAFYSSVDDGNAGAPQRVYPLLSTEANRSKLVEFLSQSNQALVGRVLALRDLNSVLLPPVYSSAGAPLDAAILINALLVQTGDFNQKFLRAFSDLVDNAKTDQTKKEILEKHFLATLVFARGLDWTQLRSVFEHFDSPTSLYDFSRLYSRLKNMEERRLLLSGLLLTRAPDLCVKYLGYSSDDRKKSDFSYALLNGSGSLEYLLKLDKPIYKDSPVARHIAPVANVIKSKLGGICAAYPNAALTMKVLVSILGGYFLARGFLRIFSPYRDTPAWYSPLALARGLLEALVVAVTFFVLVEPEAFMVKIDTGEAPPELRFAFEKIVNNIQEDTMKLDTDTATLAAVGLFLVLQFLVYLFCLIRIASIKRVKTSPQLKLKLLENEENLFDLGLYIGLAGTVVSLVLLTVGIVTASLMAAYTSTLFGILVTALVKIVHLRRFKRKLLVEIGQ